MSIVRCTTNSGLCALSSVVIWSGSFTTSTCRTDAASPVCLAASCQRAGSVWVTTQPITADAAIAPARRGHVAISDRSPLRFVVLDSCSFGHAGYRLRSRLTPRVGGAGSVNPSSIAGERCPVESASR